MRSINFNHYIMKDFWNERYKKEEFIYGTQPNDFLKSQLNLIPSKGLILFPCEGEGRNATFAAQMGWTVEAFDYSSEAQNKALNLAAKRDVKINYSVSDISDFEFAHEKYNVIAFIFSHFHNINRKDIHQKAIGALKKGGYILLEAFTPLQLGHQSGGPKDVDMLYTSNILKDDFKSLNIQHLTETQTILDEGEYHKGVAEVVRMVAQKNN